VMTRFRCRSGLRDKRHRAQANEYDSQISYLLNGDRGTAHTGPLVSRVPGSLAEERAAVRR
jgi:hypothetical protein